MYCSQAAISARAAARPEAAGDPARLLAEVSLLSANVQAEIARYLMAHGVAIDPKTRLFLANLRDVMDTLARRAGNAAV